MKSNSVSPARRSAFEILRRVEAGAYSSILLAGKSELSSRDRALRQELVLGILRHQTLLDNLIEHFANRRVDSLDQPVRIILRLGLYQLRFLRRVPASAAVNESVNLTRYARVRSAEGFVNAVLRRATREPDYDPLPVIEDQVERLSVETSHPRWLLNRWIDHFGFPFTAELARANNQPPPLSFRVIKTRATESEVAGILREAEANLIASPIAAGAWRCEGASGQLLELARAGKVYIQDEASQLVGLGLNPQPNERVLDLCSAPGSKTSHLADLAGNRATVVASDINEARLRTVTQTADLHKLSSISCVLLDGKRDLPFSVDVFDAVLIDAPCSGTGTLRRNPEIRWRISAADIQELSTRQTQLISSSAVIVKPGGRLVYSTCSVEPEENEQIVETFLASHQEFVRIDLNVDPRLVTTKLSVRTWPHRHGVDGFFIAAMMRRNN